MKISTLTVALAGVALSAQAAPAKPFRGHEYTSQAKISAEQAQRTALQVRPGKIKEQELEKEKGGSGLRYSFDIQATAATYEVGVDAVTGKVLENGKEGPHRH